MLKTLGGITLYKVLAFLNDDRVSNHLRRLEKICSTSEEVINITFQSSLEDVISKKFEGEDFQLVIFEPNLISSSKMESNYTILELFSNIPAIVVDENSNDKEHLQCGIQDIVDPKYITFEGLRRVVFYSIYRFHFHLDLLIKRKALNKVKDLLNEKSKEKISSLKLGHKKDLENTGHEFRTAINLIMGSIDLLTDQLTTDRKRRLAMAIKRNCEHLSNLAEMTIDGEIDKKEYYSISSLKQSLNDFADSSCKQKGLNFVIKSNLQDNTMLKLKSLSLKQILLNIINNAIKFTKKGEVGISLNKAAQGNLVVSIWDTGIGISEEDRDKIYNRKFRTKRSSNHKGSGIGLDVVNDLLKELKGKINCSANPVGGTIITLTFPESSIDEGLQLTEGIPDILIIEDDKDLATLYQKFLSPLSRSIHITSSLDFAQKLLSKSEYKVVISDLNLNSNTPEETIEFLDKNIKDKTKLIIVSGSKKEIQKELTKDLKLNFKLLTKPVKRQSLIDLIKDVEIKAA
jgi:signal transduction histidine kinase